MARTVYTVRTAHEPIAARATFTASAMHATATDAAHQYRGGSGRLPSDWTGTFFRDTADGQAFIVYSYGTPIAWERSDGLRVIPPVSYSTTTARHQSQVRRAWGMGYRGGLGSTARPVIYGHRNGPDAVHAAA